MILLNKSVCSQETWRIGMKFGTTVRNMGAAATTECISHCARHAENIGLDSVWVVDHIAIPPDDAEGSDGRWFDPLATLA